MSTYTAKCDICNADGTLRFIIDDQRRMEAWRSAHEGTIVPLVPQQEKT